MSNTLFNLLFIFSVGLIPGLVASINNRTFQKSESPVSFVGMTLLYLISGPFWFFYMVLTISINFLIKVHYLSGGYWKSNHKDRMLKEAKERHLLDTNIARTFDDCEIKCMLLAVFSAAITIILFVGSIVTEPSSNGIITSKVLANFFRSIVSTAGQFLVQIS